MSIVRKALLLLAQTPEVMLVSIADVKGSSPRNKGAHMIVAPNGAFAGTIGGGQLEWKALAEAQRCLKQTEAFQPGRLSVALGPDLGQCCGGRVELVFEKLGPADVPWLEAAAKQEAQRGSAVIMAERMPSGAARRRLATADEAAALPSSADLIAVSDGRMLERFGPQAWPLLLFGAGHVGRSLALALAPLPFTIRWIETRSGAFPDHVPQDVVCVHTDHCGEEVGRAPDRAIILAMTHSHGLDLEVVQGALRQRRFAFVGVIGSATKKARFATQLRRAGLPEEDLGRLVCPIGVPGIRSKEPPVIAASLAAQLLSVREQELALMTRLPGSQVSCDPGASPPSMRHGQR